jgi:hypothetical protein
VVGDCLEGNWRGSGDSLGYEQSGDSGAGSLPRVPPPARFSLDACTGGGAGFLARRHQQAAVEGGELRLVIRIASLLRFFAVFGVDQMFPIFGTLAEALDERPAVAILPQQSGQLADVRLHPAS